MKTQAGQLDIGQFIGEIRSKDPHLATTLQTITDGINQVSKNAAVGAVGDIAAPKPPDAVTVKTSGEMMHVQISHTGPVQRNIQYFTEISSNASLAGAPIVVAHGSSRTPSPIILPTYQDGGTTKHTYTVRSYAQYPGSPPSAYVYAQGTFQMNGSTVMTLLPSTGSGTAPNTGQSAGQGLGKFQTRAKSQSIVGTIGKSSQSGIGTPSPPYATGDYAGLVQPDGTTITIDPTTGVISSSGSEVFVVED